MSDEKHNVVHAGQVREDDWKFDLNPNLIHIEDSHEKFAEAVKTLEDMITKLKKHEARIYVLGKEIFYVEPDMRHIEISLCSCVGGKL
jgi:hypothetical protein